MKIVELHTRNFMGVQVVDVTPTESVVTIGGKNAQGKTSVLNSILAALGGAKLLPGEPLRVGTDKGSAIVHLNGPDGTLIVERSFTADGGTKLTIKTPEGAKFSRPQELLDKLIGSLGFDPHAFTRLDPKKQAEQLKSLVGLDLTGLDHQRQILFSDRTDVNREVKQLQARIAAMPRHDDAPEKEESIASLLAERERLEAENKATRELQQDADRARVDFADVCDEITKLEQRLAELRKRKEEASEWMLETADAVEDRKLHDLTAITERISNAEAINEKVRANASLRDEQKRLETAQSEADELTKQIEEIDANKQAAMSAAPWPVPGLGFDERGVTYNGLPFSQASSAEQLRVSLAMGMALNPKLRVLIMRDGNLADDDTMQTIRETVEANDFQLWVERVSSTGEGCSLVISEGKVAECGKGVPMKS